MPQTVLGWLQENSSKLGTVEVKINTLQADNETLRAEILSLRQLVADTQAAVLQIQNTIG
jgi:hypothetical protein